MELLPCGLSARYPGCSGYHPEQFPEGEVIMKIATSWSTESDSALAISQTYHDLEERLGTTPDLVIVYASVLYDSAVLMKELRSLAPKAQIQGATSCLGVMTESGFYSADGVGMGLLGLSDPQGSYGVGAVSMGDNPKASAAAAVNEALRNAGRPGELPGLIWLTSAPGQEEALLQGIEGLVGMDVPIIGGSSADNTVEGHWKQFANGRVYSDAVVVTVMFPSVKTAFAFLSGYAPTDIRGKATRAEGRTVYEIDGLPAAEVYNEWTGGAISEALPDGGNVLSLTTLYPVGRVVGSVSGVPYYRLSHPDAVTPEGALSFFSEIQAGEQLVLMTGSQESLISRAGRVAQAAMDSQKMTPSDISGGLVVYCAGCMLTVRSDMEQVVAGVKEVLGGKPFLGVFTFGEQGCFTGGENRHGNLMISVIVFGK
jgi:hypothetical protein